MAIRLRTKKLIQSGLIGAGIALVISGTGGFFFYKNAQEKEVELRNEYKAKLEELQQTTLQSEVVYSLVADVEKGELISSDLIQQVHVPIAAAPEDSFQDHFIKGENPRNYYAKTDLKANTVLTQSMVYRDEPITRDVREAEYSFIELPMHVKKGDYLDLRIQFPTGDDFVLLSKKKVKDVAGLTVWFDVDEGEILTMSSAIVDAYTEKAKIYALPYVDEHMQEASDMTYPVKENVKQLIRESPNIVNFAKLNLDKQNRERVEMNLHTISDEHVNELRNGENQTKSEVERLLQERHEKLESAGEYLSQQDLIGGNDYNGGDEE